MKTIYRFKIYNINKDAYVFSEKYATEEYIKTIQAIIVKDSKMEVNKNQVDGEGIYIREQNSHQPLSL